MKRYCFDLDNTLCETFDGKYHESQPIEDAVKAVNNLYKKGEYIIIFTARMMGRCQGNQSKVYEEIYELTKNQLKEWGVNHHELILAKPEYDILIDDKSLNFDQSWYKKFI